MAEAKTRRIKTVGSLEPWLPVDWDLADASALQAIQRGDATPEQCVRALKWVVNKACATYEVPYRPGGQDGDRNTSFACGRQFVGQQIVKLLNLNLSDFRKKEKPDD
jgi:hypothetical protein